MKKEKRWIGVTVLLFVTVVAFIAGILIQKGLEPSDDSIIDVAGYEDKGIAEASKIMDAGENITGYKVVVDSKGYSSTPIKMAVTFNATGDKVTALEIISHRETPGYGAKITESDYLKQFIDVKLPVYMQKENESTDKEGTKVDVITEATYSSEAMVKGVNNAREFILELLNK